MAQRDVWRHQPVGDLRDGDALRQVVPLAGRRGIPRLLVTCDLDNVGSARVIESCGGELEGELQGKRRYWIDTGA